MNIDDHVAMIQQQQIAPALVEKVASEEDTDELTELCAELEALLREECQVRGLGKHAASAACYMVVNRLANPEQVDR